MPVVSTRSQNSTVLAAFAVSTSPKTTRFRADEILSIRAGLEIDHPWLRGDQARETLGHNLIVSARHQRCDLRARERSGRLLPDLAFG